MSKYTINLNLGEFDKDSENHNDEGILDVLSKIIIRQGGLDDRIGRLESNVADIRENLIEDNYEKTRRLSEIERSLDNLKVVRSDSHTSLD